MIYPVEFSGIVQRTQDVSTMKQNEDVKPMFENMNAQHNVQQHVTEKHETVVKQDNADKKQDQYDAKEKGNGQYYDSNQNKKKRQQEDGRVIKKSDKEHGSFDISI